MATIRGAAAGNSVDFTPISAELNNLPNGAGTIAALARFDSHATGDDICGLVNSGSTDWYHTLISAITSGKIYDDVGPAFVQASSGSLSTGSTADDFCIAVVDWSSTGTTLERMHYSSTMGSAESWTHVDSAGNNQALRAGPGTNGRFRICSFADAGPINGDVALVAVWAGTRFTDTDVTNLWVNKKTSDWCNHPAGQPTLLVECNTLTPVDIGAHPSTFASATGVTLTGLDPTGWTFDGCPAVPPPDAHVAWITA